MLYFLEWSWFIGFSLNSHSVMLSRYKVIISFDLNDEYIRFYYVFVTHLSQQEIVFKKDKATLHVI